MTYYWERTTKIYSVADDEFRAYGRVWADVDPAITGAITGALAEKTPLPEVTGYVPEEPAVQDLPEAQALAPTLFGGLSVEFGWCNGHNLTLNCLEYHRSSEFNLGVGDFVLLLALQSDIRDGRLDTSTVKAFRVPAGTLVEVYATTLHYAPCQVSDAGFKVLVALPQGTNGPLPELHAAGGDAGLLWANNKWLLAHAESAEAAQGAYVGLVGENITIENQE